MAQSSKTDAIKGEVTMLINGDYYVLPYKFYPSFYMPQESNGKPAGKSKMNLPLNITVQEPKSDGGKGEDKLMKMITADSIKGFKAEIEIPNNVEHGQVEKWTLEDCYIISYSPQGDMASMTISPGKVSGKEFKEVQSWSNVK